MRAPKRDRLINVVLTDGTPKRVGTRRAEALLDSGQASRYISNTVYRALKNGIEVKDLGTRDPDGKLKALVREAEETAKAKAAKAKAEAEKAKREAEDAERPERQTRQKRRKRRRRSEASA